MRPIAPIALVVDDDQQTRRLIGKALGTCGVAMTSVESESDGVAAIGSLSSRHGPPFLILDLGLWGSVRGEDLLGLARQEGFEGVAIVVSAETGPGWRDRCRREGVDACLEKPFETAELAGVVAAWWPSPTSADPAVWGKRGANSLWASYVELRDAVGRGGLEELSLICGALCETAFELGWAGVVRAGSAIASADPARVWRAVAELRLAVEESIGVPAIERAAIQSAALA